MKKIEINTGIHLCHSNSCDVSASREKQWRQAVEDNSDRREFSVTTYRPGKITDCVKPSSTISLEKKTYVKCH